MASYEAAGENDEWYTPPHVFEALGCRFDMDVAAPVDRTFVCVPADRFISSDSLEMEWSEVSLFSVDGDIIRPWKSDAQAAEKTSLPTTFISASVALARAGSPLNAANVSATTLPLLADNETLRADRDVSLGRRFKHATDAPSKSPQMAATIHQRLHRETDSPPAVEFATERLRGFECRISGLPTQTQSGPLIGLIAKVKWGKSGSANEAGSITLSDGSEGSIAALIGGETTGETFSPYSKGGALIAAMKAPSTKITSSRFPILSAPEPYRETLFPHAPLAICGKDGAIRVPGLAMMLRSLGFPTSLPCIGLVGRPLIWVNPPFGHQATKRAWLSKFFDHGNGIALTPDRTSAPWFQEAWTRADLVMFTPKIKFIRPDGTRGESPGTGTCLWASGPSAVSALRRAAAAGLGILATPERTTQ